MKIKAKMYKVFKIFNWKFAIKIPDFLNLWEYDDENQTITFASPPNKNDIIEMRYENESK